jgi:hypothetical protein
MRKRLPKAAGLAPVLVVLTTTVALALQQTNGTGLTANGATVGYNAREREGRPRSVGGLLFASPHAAPRPPWRETSGRARSRLNLRSQLPCLQVHTIPEIQEQLPAMIEREDGRGAMTVEVETPRGSER